MYKTGVLFSENSKIDRFFLTGLFRNISECIPIQEPKGLLNASQY